MKSGTENVFQCLQTLPKWAWIAKIISTQDKGLTERWNKQSYDELSKALAKQSKRRTRSSLGLFRWKKEEFFFRKFLGLAAATATWIRCCPRVVPEAANTWVWNIRRLNLSHYFDTMTTDSSKQTLGSVGGHIKQLVQQRHLNEP